MQGRVHFDYIIGGSGLETLEPWNLRNPGKLGKLEDFMGGRRTLGVGGKQEPTTSGSVRATQGERDKAKGRNGATRVEFELTV